MFDIINDEVRGVKSQFGLFFGRKNIRTNQIDEENIYLV